MSQDMPKLLMQIKGEMHESFAFRSGLQEDDALVHMEYSRQIFGETDFKFDDADLNGANFRCFFFFRSLVIQTGYRIRNIK